MRGTWQTTSGGGGLVVAAVGGAVLAAAMLPAVLAAAGRVITALAWLAFAAGWLAVMVAVAGVVWGRRVTRGPSPYAGMGARLVAERDAQARVAGGRGVPALPVTVNVIGGTPEQIAAAVTAARREA